MKKSEWEAELRNEIYQISHLWVSLYPRQVSREQSLHPEAAMAAEIRRVVV